MSRQKKRGKSAVGPASIFKDGLVGCRRCGQMNDLGSGEALYRADDSTRCAHCGFLFIRHAGRELAMLTELLKTDPEWMDLARRGQVVEMRRRLEKLVPISEEP